MDNLVLTDSNNISIVITIIIGVAWWALNRDVSMIILQKQPLMQSGGWSDHVLHAILVRTRLLQI